MSLHRFLQSSQARVLLSVNAAAFGAPGVWPTKNIYLK